MELEEAIEILKSYENKLVYEISEKDKEAVAVVLNQLDSLKFKYQARKDRTDTIITKQEKMIQKIHENFCKFDWKNSNGEQVHNQLKELYESIFKNEESE